MEIYNASFSPTSKALTCFSAAPHRVILRPGERLYRFGSMFKEFDKSNQVFGSPWWIPRATYTQISKTAHRTSQSTIDVARSRLAVTTEWNLKMDTLIIIEFQKAVQAWVGPAKPQPLFDGDRSVMLLGAYEQAYIPWPRTGRNGSWQSGRERGGEVDVFRVGHRVKVTAASSQSDRALSGSRSEPVPLTGQSGDPF